MKAWAFYRRSTDRQELSIADQRRECREFAASRGWEIVREFEPIKGWGSGLTIDHDPSFKEMVRLAENGAHGISYLVVYDVSRFGRLDPQMKLYWETHFRRQGINVIYIRDDFKNDGSLGDILTKVVKHSEAHEYSRKLSETTLRGAKSHAALGHSPGGKAPYGYNRLEIDSAGTAVRVMARTGDWKSNKMHRVIWTPSPSESPVIRSIFDAYERREGLRSIAESLNENKVPAPRGPYWSKLQIRYMIRNRAYIGERIYNRSSYKAYRRGERMLANAQGSWVVKEEAHPPIISKEQFEQVQAMIQRRTVTIGRTFQRPYLLTGITFCSNCGYRLMGYPKAGKGYRYLTYTCSGYHRLSKGVCKSFHVEASQLEEAVVQAVRDQIREPNIADMVRQTLETMLRQEFGHGADEQIKMLKARLGEIDRQLANMVAAVKNGGFSATLNRALGDLEEEKRKVGEELSRMEGRSNQRIGAEVLTEKIMGRFANFDKLWNETTAIEERKEFLRGFVRQVTVDHSASEPTAKIWLWKIPQKTLGQEDTGPLFPRVNCGGQYLTLRIEEIPPPDLMPMLMTREIRLLR